MDTNTLPLNTTPQNQESNASVSIGKTFVNAVGRFGKNTIEQLLVNPLKDTAIHYMICPAKYISVKVMQHTPFLMNNKNVAKWNASSPDHYVEKKKRMITRDESNKIETPLWNFYKTHELRIPKYVKKSSDELATESRKEHAQRKKHNRFLVDHTRHGLDVLVGKPIDYLINDIVLFAGSLMIVSTASTLKGATYPLRASYRHFTDIREE